MPRPSPSTLARTARTVLLALSLASVLGCAAGGSHDAAAAAPATRSYAFWPQFPDDPRIQFVRSIGSCDDVAKVQASGLEKLVFGKDAPTAEAINKPYGVAMRDGKIYVCDIRAGCLVVLDLAKKQTRLVGASGAHQLKHPVAVAIADDGTLYVADNDQGAVFVFDTAERYANVFGHPKFKPAALAVHGDRLYASDTAAQVVEIFDRRDGRPLGAIGSVGDGDGQFRLPLGVATTPNGDVLVVDMMRCCVQRFSPEGTFISTMGTMGDYAGSFARPKHIAVDGDGIIYVVDAAFQSVQMFDDQNRLLMHFGAAGSFPGSMNLPAGICACDDASVNLFADGIHPGFQAKRLIVVTN